MTVYLDMIFLLNCLTDAAALYVTGRLSGLPLERKRVLAASLLGGTYGALCALPGWGAAASLLPQAAAAAGLVRLAFGRREFFLRRLLLFFILSCAMAGALVAGGRLLREQGGLAALAALDWRVFFLAGGACFVILSVVFRGGARHGAAGFLLGGGTAASVVENGELSFPAGRTGILSVFCPNGEARGVTLRGLRYPLRDAVLTSAFPLGVSNQFIGEAASVSVRDGALLVMWEQEDGALPDQLTG